MVTKTYDIERQAIIVVGNVADGFTHTGPFENGVEANEYADEHLAGEEWWVVSLIPPYPDREYEATQAGAQLSEQDEILDPEPESLQGQFREHYPDGIGEPS